MTGCLESPLASPVLAQSWSQTATDGAWFSTTALLSGRDRPLRLCVLRPRGSEPETRCTSVWRSLRQASAFSRRALANGVRPLSVTNRCRVHKSANARPRISTFSVLLRHTWPEVRRWSTYLAESSSSWELRAGRTGPTVIALPRLQTALKTVRKRVRVSQSYNLGFSLSVRSEIRMIDVSTYEGAYDMGDMLRHGIQLSLVP